MTAFLGEHQRVDLAIITAGGSSYDSKPYSLADVDKVMVLCAMGPSTGAAAQSATFTVTVGTYSTSGGSAFSVLTSATLMLGHATATDFNNMEEININPIGTLASGSAITIDGTSWVNDQDSSLGDNEILSSANSALTLTLSCAIATGATGLEVTNLDVAGTAGGLTLRPRDYGFAGPMTSGMGITLNANATTDSWGAIAQKWSGMIEFQPANIVATNASYTHFAVRVNTAGTSTPMTALVVRTGGLNATQQKRQQVAT